MTPLGKCIEAESYTSLREAKSAYDFLDGYTRTVQVTAVLKCSEQLPIRYHLFCFGANRNSNDELKQKAAQRIFVLNNLPSQVLLKLWFLFIWVCL